MNYPKPYGNRVLVRVKQLTAGKVIISALAKNRGEIVALSETNSTPHHLNIGDNIMFSEFQKKDIEVQEDKGNTYLLVEIEGIQAIL